jgi:hypothetical protein
MTQGLADTTAVPMPIYWAVAGIIVLVVEHIFALVTPPTGCTSRCCSISPSAVCTPGWPSWSMPARGGH